MNPGDQQQKSNLRKEFLQRRNSLSISHMYSKSKIIQDKLIRCAEYIESKSIAIYLPIGSEVQTFDIIRHALESEKTLLLPRVILNDIHYFIVKKHDFDNHSFDTNKFGFKEPKIGNLKLDFIDLLIVPGIVFDCHGYRIGYGYGYYDRFMAKREFLKSIGLAYDFQIMKNPIPRFDHDRKIDILITESGFQVFDAF